MRSIVRAAGVALFSTVLLAGSSRAQSPGKIGYINSAQILAQAPGRAEAEAQFEREVAAYRTQLQRMSDSLNTLSAAFDRDAPKLDSATRESRARTLRGRDSVYQGRASDLNQRMQLRQAELVKPIMEKVQTVMETLRSEQGYAFIFDVGSQASVIVAADKRLDLTDQVLARLGVTKTAAPSGSLVPQPAGVSRTKK